jgi:hypothetical protein
MVNPALAKFIKTIKDEDKAKNDPGFALKQIIDDYCLSGRFDDYLKAHGGDLANFLHPETTSAGKCLQAQAFRALFKMKPDLGGTEPSIVERPARQQRALDNGTMMHLRYHMMFDHLHELGLVQTLAGEQMRYNEELKVSGTIDRVVAYDVNRLPITAILDFKSSRHRYFDALVGPQDDHVLQQHCYRLFGFETRAWAMVYECKDEHDLKIYVRPYDENVLSVLQANYRRMDTWIDETLAGREAEKLPLITDWCNYCEYRNVCDIVNPDRRSKCK